MKQKSKQNSAQSYCPAAINLRDRRLIFVLSGPSGSGKTTLLKKLLQQKELKQRLVRSVSVTTRPKRSGEKEGGDYSFLTEREFKKLRQDENFLEWTRYLSYYYATPKDVMENYRAQNRHLILCLDLRGALKIKRLYPKDTITIFVKPPYLEALRQRIKKRCQKTAKAEIQKRLKLAKDELSASRRYDYCLENKDLTEAVKELKDIILSNIGRY